MKFAVIDLNKRKVVSVEPTMVAATEAFYSVTTGPNRITAATTLPIADWLEWERLEVVGDLCGLSVVPALERADDRTMREIMALAIGACHDDFSDSDDWRDCVE